MVHFFFFFLRCLWFGNIWILLAKTFSLSREVLFGLCIKGVCWMSVMVKTSVLCMLVWCFPLERRFLSSSHWHFSKKSLTDCLATSADLCLTNLGIQVFLLAFPPLCEFAQIAELLGMDHLQFPFPPILMMWGEWNCASWRLGILCQVWNAFAAEIASTSKLCSVNKSATSYWVLDSVSFPPHILGSFTNVDASGCLPL